MQGAGTCFIEEINHCPSSLLVWLTFYNFHLCDLLLVFCYLNADFTDCCHLLPSVVVFFCIDYRFTIFHFIMRTSFHLIWHLRFSSDADNVCLTNVCIIIIINHFRP